MDQDHMMEYTELAKLIVNDWSKARLFLEAMTLRERDMLIDDVIVEYGSQPPTEARSLAVAKYVRSLHFDPTATNEGRNTPEKAGQHGTTPVMVWNRVAQISLEHATSFHMYIAKYFCWCLSQTQVGQKLPNTALDPQVVATTGLGAKFIPGQVLE